MNKSNRTTISQKILPLLFLIMTAVWYFCEPIALEMKNIQYNSLPSVAITLIVKPLVSFLLGYIVVWFVMLFAQTPLVFKGKTAIIFKVVSFLAIVIYLTLAIITVLGWTKINLLGLGVMLNPQMLYFFTVVGSVYCLGDIACKKD